MKTCRNGHPREDSYFVGTRLVCRQCAAARNARWYNNHVRRPDRKSYGRRACSVTDCNGTYVWSTLEMCNYHQRRMELQLRREAHNQRCNRWAKANREKKVNMANRRRAAKGDFTAAAWIVLKSLFGHTCAYCRRRFTRLEQDHVTPLTRGGTHSAGNIVPACRSCNAAKGNR